MKIAIIGYGVVGGGVYDIIKKNAETIKKRTGQSIEVKYIVDIRDFPDHPEKEIFVKDFSKVLEDDQVQVVVETMGGIRFAYDYTCDALKKGKSVVTSNKELVAAHGHEFFALAKEHNCRYLFEASVGGGIPVIRPLARCLAANEIQGITGIINGTTNYILTKMFKENYTFDAALKQAQELGYAEKDPTADVEGIDVCRKIAILSSLALGKRVDSALIPTEGIRNITVDDVSYAAVMNYAIKLVGCARFKDGKAGVFVAPMLIPKTNPLSGIEDVFNGVLIKGNMVDDVMFYGKGAGKLPTASAVVADVMDIAKAPAYTEEFTWEADQDDVTFDPDEIETRFFVRVKKEALDAAKKKFGEIEAFNGVHDMGFITEVMSRKEVEKRLAEIDGVVSKMRIFR